MDIFNKRYMSVSTNDDMDNEFPSYVLTNRISPDYNEHDGIF